jgi:hypothetical protein
MTLTGLTQPHICVCPKPGPEFQTPYSEVGLFVFIDFRRDVFARFVHNQTNKRYTPNANVQ